MSKVLSNALTNLKLSERVPLVPTSGVSLEAGYRRYTAVFVVTNLPLTAGYCGLIFTQTLIVIAAYFD